LLYLIKFEKTHNMDNKKIFKAVPFTAKINRGDTAQKVAEQIQFLIDEYSQDGWAYLRLESVETTVAPVQGGCFDKHVPGYTTSFKVVIFEKNI